MVELATGSLRLGLLEESAILLVSEVEKQGVGIEDEEDEVCWCSGVVEGVWLVVAADNGDRKGKGSGRKGGERGETARGKPKEDLRDRGLERREDP